MTTVNPVAKLGAALLLAVCLVLSIDWVSASVALALELVAFAFIRLPPRVFWVRTLSVWVAAPLTGVTIALYGQTEGQVYVEFAFARVSEGSITLAIATVLRVLAIGLPAVVLFVTVDPTELADGLAQRVGLPARFVLGALAGMRLVSLFLEDWRALELARRARGVSDTARLRRLAGQAFAMFVLSLRRGTSLATAMEARGFGASVERTWARESPWAAREWLVLAAGLAIGLVSLAAAVASGRWNFIVGQ
ncbi:MAG: energy-coupling factor transporter transmembrane protein EcfT [Salinibacterium sp.]|nr:energy-coupling factor transporter transmembrane protein EcfT [Salinibacterium sp.]